jgi:hypothetical protein
MEMKIMWRNEVIETTLDLLKAKRECEQTNSVIHLKITVDDASGNKKNKES